MIGLTIVPDDEAMSMLDATRPVTRTNSSSIHVKPVGKVAAMETPTKTEHTQMPVPIP